MDQMNEGAAPGTQIAEYSATAAALGELRAKFEDVIFAVCTTAGMKDAIGARATLRDLRVGLEKMRKSIKEPALERCRLIDAEARSITAQLTALEDPIDAQIQAEQARKAAEKAEADRIERERVAAIRAKIDAIRNLPLGMTSAPAAEIAAEIDALRDFVPDTDFAELAGEAASVANAVRDTLISMHTNKANQEAEAARVAAEREELRKERELADEQERHRAAAAKAEQDERDRVAAETKRQLDAQAAKIAADRKAEADRLAAERAAFEEERRVFVEQQRKVAQAADRAAAAAEERAELAATITVLASTMPAVDVTDLAGEIIAITETGWTPSGSDFVHPSTYAAFETIDAAMFTGFPSLHELLAIEWYIARWSKQAGEVRDIHNAEAA